MKRILKWLARLYPSTWRARYGAEYDALLDDATPHARDAFDVIWGAAKMQITNWSFVRIVLICSSAGAMAAVAISLIPSNKYMSQAAISVDTPYPHAIDKWLAGQVQDWLASPFLISAIQKEDLYPNERARMPLSDVVDLMRKNIILVPVRQTRHGTPASAFRIEFVYSDPRVAQKVDSVLVSRILASNLQAAINDPSASSRPPMTFRVERAADLRQSPTFPKRGLFGAGGLLAGLIGGLVAAAIARRRRLTLVAD